MSFTAIFRQQSRSLAFGLSAARTARPTVLRQFSTTWFRQQQSSWAQRGASEYASQDTSFYEDHAERTPRHRQNNDSRVSFRKPNPPSSILFVGNLPFSVDAAEVREVLEAFGTISELRMAMHQDGRFKGYAHVEYANQADAVRLYETNQDEPVTVLDRPLRLDYSAPKRPSARPQEPHHVLHVYNFGGGVKDLVDVFRTYGVTAKNINYMKDKETGAVLDKFWVDMQTVDRATEALSDLNGITTPSGHQLRVAYGRPRPISPNNYGGEWGGGRKSSGYRSQSSYGLKQPRSE